MTQDERRRVIPLATRAALASVRGVPERLKAA